MPFRRRLDLLEGDHNVRPQTLLILVGLYLQGLLGLGPLRRSWFKRDNGSCDMSLVSFFSILGGGLSSLLWPLRCWKKAAWDRTSFCFLGNFESIGLVIWMKWGHGIREFRGAFRGGKRPLHVSPAWLPKRTSAGKEKTWAEEDYSGMFKDEVKGKSQTDFNVCTAPYSYKPSAGCYRCREWRLWL